MSKKCCGKIYPDDAEICDICGLPIEQTSDPEEEELLKLLMEQDAMEDKPEDADSDDVEDVLRERKDIRVSDGKAPKGLKAAGIAFLSLAVIGLALVGTFIYFMAISPYYDKNDKRFDLNYPELASYADADKIREPLEMMATPSDATISDAVAEEQGVE